MQVSLCEGGHNGVLRIRKGEVENGCVIEKQTI